MRFITQIQLEGGFLHEHISRVRWKNATATGEASRAEMVQWVRAGGNVCVESAPNHVKVEVVDGTPPYLRAKANGLYTDNLLELPRF